jgi:hypothetical protein
MTPRTFLSPSGESWTKGTSELKREHDLVVAL